MAHDDTNSWVEQMLAIIGASSTPLTSSEIARQLQAQRGTPAKPTLQSVRRALDRYVRNGTIKRDISNPQASTYSSSIIQSEHMRDDETPVEFLARTGKQ